MTERRRRIALLGDTSVMKELARQKEFVLTSMITKRHRVPHQPLSRSVVASTDRRRLSAEDLAGYVAPDQPLPLRTMTRAGLLLVVRDISREAVDAFTQVARRQRQPFCLARRQIIVGIAAMAKLKINARPFH